MLWGGVYRGWARSVERRDESGIDEIRAAILAWHELDNRYLASHFNGLLADALIKQARFADALDVLDTSVALGGRNSRTVHAVRAIPAEGGSAPSANRLKR